MKEVFRFASLQNCLPKSWLPDLNKEGIYEFLFVSKKEKL